MIPRTTFAASMALLSACTAAETARTDVEHGAAFFAANCAACHGADGTGRDLLTGRSPDLTGLSARTGGAFPTIDVLSKIHGWNDPASVMPSFGDGDLGPTVVVELEEGIGTPIPADLVALGTYLEALQRR